MANRDSDEIIRFSVSLPKSLLDTLDTNLTFIGYSSRSEVIRDMIREMIVEKNWQNIEDSGEVVAVLVIVYDHHQRDLNQKMIDVQHNSHVEILCNTHVHINHNN